MNYEKQWRTTHYYTEHYNTTTGEWQLKSLSAVSTAAQGCQAFLINKCQIIHRIMPKMPTRKLNNAKLEIKVLYTIISKKV